MRITSEWLHDPARTYVEMAEAMTILENRAKNLKEDLLVARKSRERRLYLYKTSTIRQNFILSARDEIHLEKMIIFKLKSELTQLRLLTKEASEIFRISYYREKKQQDVELLTAKAKSVHWHKVSRRHVEPRLKKALKTMKKIKTVKDRIPILSSKNYDDFLRLLEDVESDLVILISHQFKEDYFKFARKIWNSSSSS